MHYTASSKKGIIITILLALSLVLGCKEDEGTTNPPSNPPSSLTASPSSATVTAGDTVRVTIRGGVKPYVIFTRPDTNVASTSVSDSTLTVIGKAAGTTSVTVKDNDTAKITVPITVNARPPLSASVSEVSVAPSGSTTVTISGGTPPYMIHEEPDTIVATALLSGTTLTINGVAGGYTTVMVMDNNNTMVSVAITVSGPITYDLFPLVLGRRFIYDGNGISTSGATIPDPNNVYQTIWTIGPAGPIPGTTVIVDTTTIELPSPIGIIGVRRNLLILKNPGNGDFIFFQTLGPFFRAFGIPRTDTVRAVLIAKPSLGIGGTWTAFDSSYTSGTNSTIRLEILGEVVNGETVVDSSVSHTLRNTIHFRTKRRISVNGTIVVPGVETSELWLEKNVGPVKVIIYQDSENIGHFRVLKAFQP
jgi:hypothetical protein